MEDLLAEQINRLDTPDQKGFIIDDDTKTRIKTLMQLAAHKYPTAFYEVITGEYYFDKPGNDALLLDDNGGAERDIEKQPSDLELLRMLIEIYLEERPKEVRKRLGIDQGDNVGSAEEQSICLFNFSELLFKLFYSRHQYTGAIDETDFIGFIIKEKWRVTAESIYKDYNLLRKIWLSIRNIVLRQANTDVEMVDVTLPVRFMNRFKLAISVEGSPRKISFRNATFNLADAFIDTLNGIEVDRFARCPYCNRCIVKLTKRRVYCSYTNCNVRHCQDKAKERDIEDFRRKDRERKRKNNPKKTLE